MVIILPINRPEIIFQTARTKKTLSCLRLKLCWMLYFEEAYSEPRQMSKMEVF